MPSHPGPSSSTWVPCQQRGHPSLAPENSHIHLDANCICVHCWTWQSPQWWRTDAAVGTWWKSLGMVLKWSRWRNTNNLCCVWCVC
jgi:hypothetical protein